MDEEIRKLTERLDNLQNAFVQSLVNNIPITEKADSVISVDGKVDALGEQTESIKANLSGEYDKSKPYTMNEYCLYNGDLFRFTKESGQGISPDNENYWALCDVATELNRIVALINN